MENMSTVNLIILGLLQDKSMSAYEMAQIVDSWVMRKLLKISSPTVYKNLKALYKEKYLAAETVKEGEMPEKKIYSVTKTGRAYFIKLMEYYSSNLNDFYFDFNMFLVNLDKVDKPTGLKMLENLQKQINQARNWIVQHEQENKANNIPFAGRMLVKQYRMVLSTLRDWIEEAIFEYRQTTDLGKNIFSSEHINKNIKKE
ncbi:PadR family transcriptional regulator [Candidatus Poribacteria bacterium]|nr:PadR family transcriptional regulator [Candidatus Poribacteria bacterium]